MSKTRRQAPRVGRTPDLLRKSHVHPRRLVEPEIDWDEIAELDEGRHTVVDEELGSDPWELSI